MICRRLYWVRLVRTLILWSIMSRMSDRVNSSDDFDEEKTNNVHIRSINSNNNVQDRLSYDLFDYTDEFVIQEKRPTRQRLIQKNSNNDDNDNSICYVCSDDGKSTITKPDAIIQLPDIVDIQQATCEEIRMVAEDLLLVPKYACNLLDTDVFRTICGCENVVDNNTPISSSSSSSSPTPIPSIEPVTSEPSWKPTQKSTKSPSLRPFPEPTPEPTPESTIISQNSDFSSDSSCLAHPICVSEGSNNGNCCPTDQFIFRSCCSFSTPTTIEPTPADDDERFPLDIPDDTTTPSRQNPTTTIPSMQNPTIAPTKTKPTPSPTIAPTKTKPTPSPTIAPTKTKPTPSPTPTPSFLPTVIPTTKFPTTYPSSLPFVTTGLPTSSEPSFRPSLLPTITPSLKTTDKPPTVSPTFIPSAEPTKLPSLEPTQSTTSAIPTVTPTANPSFEPTISFSKSPTTTPSSVPTNLPSNVPTTLSSTQPTIIPTDSPSYISNVPTVLSSTQPTIFPTSSPSAVLSSTPTSYPSAIPTTQASIATTDKPTLFLSDMPTQLPSEKPLSLLSLSPSTMPSDLPSTVLSSKPSETPTLAPSDYPSSQPSISLVPTISLFPTAAPTQKFQFQKVTLSEESVRLRIAYTRRRLEENDNSNCTILWRNGVRDMIDAEVRDLVPQVESLRVHLYNEATEEEIGFLVLVFDVLIEVRSPVMNHNILRYIEGPFDTIVEKQRFAEFLTDTGCPEFSNIGGIELIIPKAEGDDGIVEDTQKSSSSSTGLIAGIAVAATAVVIVSSLFVWNRRKNWLKGTESQANNVGTDDNDYASEIGIDAANDVSTLGDPIDPGGARTGDGSTIGSTGLDLDFQQVYMEAHSVTDSQLAGSQEEGGPNAQISTLPSALGAGTTGNFFLQADDTAEEHFEIIVPAGPLGLLLESNMDDGRPTVHSVKANSMLANVVRIGDRLISVDGADVSNSPALTVSHLIAAKKDQPTRTFVFSRPKFQDIISVVDSDIFDTNKPNSTKWAA